MSARRLKVGGFTLSMSSLACLLLLTVILIAETVGAIDAPRPLTRAHAHNDYLHLHPLVDALDHGFCSVEADIHHLVNGRLLVAHDRQDVRLERTLQALYLDPLRERAKRNGGRIYRDGPPSITLLIDVKSEAESTYGALREVLSQYKEILTSFGPESVQTRAVTVIVSGNRARETMRAEKLRYAAYDGRLEDLDSHESHRFIPLISANWALNFKWRGDGEFPAGEKQKLRDIVEKTHQQRRRLRFWGTPERATLWRELIDAGVDLINTDDLDGLQGYLNKHGE